MATKGGAGRAVEGKWETGEEKGMNWPCQSNNCFRKCAFALPITDSDNWHLKPVERFENGSDMWGFRSLNNSTSKKVLNLLEPVRLIVRKVVFFIVSVFFSNFAPCKLTLYCKAQALPVATRLKWPWTSKSLTMFTNASNRKRRHNWQ